MCQKEKGDPTVLDFLSHGNSYLRKSAPRKFRKLNWQRRSGVLAFMVKTENHASVKWHSEELLNFLTI